MSPTGDRPLKIVVLGSSCSLWVSPPRTHRDEGTYGELLPNRLEEHGYAAEVRHTGKWFDMIHEARRRYEYAVRAHYPDVLILNYGLAEEQPNFLPTWAVRHFTSWDISTRPLGIAYRNRVAPRLWRVARSWQRFTAKLSTTHSWRLSPERFTRELDRIVSLAREELRCLVLVLDIDPPDGRLLHWLPGLDQRWAHYQDVVRRHIAELADPEVRLIPASAALVEHLGLEVGLPDGMHRSAPGHVLMADMLTAEIVDWLKHQPDHR
jgi:lysophospholipase L1-like esterase